MDQGNRNLHREAKTAALILAVLLVAALFPLLAACDESGILPVGGTSPQSEFTRNEQKWRAQKITSYEFELERQCFCPEDFRGPVDITVRDGKPASVVYVNSGLPATADKFGSVDNIEEMFALIRDAIQGRNSFSQKAESVEVTYHPDLGYPLTIFIDVSRSIADEEQGYTVRGFRAGR